MPGDRSPDIVCSDEETRNEAPIGDIAELTSRVSENASVPSSAQAGVTPTSARVTIYTSKKNKGVGKGSSGSSGPPKKPKAKPTSTVSIPLDESSSDEASSGEEEVQPIATQTITVGAKRGYTHYPGYLFDVPPKKLKTDTLRKKLMISEIKRSETQTQFYERGMVLMSHLKEFLRLVAMSGLLGDAYIPDKEDAEEHGYALNKGDEDKSPSDK